MEPADLRRGAFAYTFSHMIRRFKLACEAVAGALWKRLLGSHVQAVLVDTDEGLFAVDPEDFGIGRRLRYRGACRSEELQRLGEYLPDDGEVLIVGAHIGTLAVPISRACRRVVAVEANPRSVDLLKMNLVLNDVSNCRVIHTAANDRHDPIEFLLSRANSGGSKRVPQVRSFLYYYDKPETISVPGAPLDDVLERHDFDLIVMDIEGSEVFALRGMQDILSRSQALAVEFVPHHLRNVSGVSVDEFLAPIEPHFQTLRIPSKGVNVESEGFLRTLQMMFLRGEEDDGIIFEKGPS